MKRRRQNASQFSVDRNGVKFETRGVSAFAAYILTLLLEKWQFSAFSIALLSGGVLASKLGLLRLLAS